MSEPDNLLDDYLYGDNNDNQKANLRQKLINESPEQTLEEKGLDNLLSIHFEPIDISSKCLNTIQNLEDSTEATEFSNKVIKDIKTRQKRSATLPILLSVAALIAIGIFMKFNSSQTFPSEGLTNNIPKAGDILNGSAEHSFSDGLSVKSSKDSSYTYINSPEEFLKLSSGSLEIDVDSRANRQPLIFTMPHAQVKVTGTKFNLLTNHLSSQVSVSQGSIEFQKASTTFLISKGEVGISDENTIRKKYLFSDNESDYTFEEENSSPILDGILNFKPGIIGNALEFSGIQKVRIKRKASTSDESFSMWIQVSESSPIGQSIAGQHDPIYSTNGFHLYEEKGELHLQIKNSEKEYGKVFKIDLKKWTHLAFTKNLSGQNKLYINGELALEHLMKYEYKSSSEFYLGKSEDRFWAPLRGLIDELRIYRKVLNEDEVKKLFSEKNLIKNVTK